MCLVITHVFTYICIYQGIKTSSVVVYITAPLPIIILFILMIKGFTLPGCSQGLIYLYYPDFTKLWDYEIWIKAANQVVFVLSLGFGGNILFASYRNVSENVYGSSVRIPILTIGCGFLSATINFSFLGHLSYLTNTPIEELPLSGIDLAFITYPSVISLLPWPNVWAVVFFIMLITLGIDSQVFIYFYTVLIQLIAFNSILIYLVCFRREHWTLLR